MLNLNKKLVTKEGLLKYIQDIDVYKFYSNQEVVLKVAIKSPLRDEANPSFGYFIGEHNEICFKDFILGGGDFVKFVQLKFNLNFFEALSKIAIDFNLTEYFYIKENVIKTINNNKSQLNNKKEFLNSYNKIKLKKKRRKWKFYDLAYWLQYGIDKNTLIKYKVEPISHIFINDNPITVDKYSYAYKENKENNISYKIYQPFNKNFKWLNNHNESVWQGWEQLPLEDDILIITKSLKDVMAINNICNISSISLQSESVLPKKHIIEQLKERFSCIFILYDNDFDKDVNFGREFARKIADKFDLTQIELPTRYKSKDFSDLVKNKGKKKAKKIIDELLDIPF